MIKSDFKNIVATREYLKSEEENIKQKYKSTIKDLNDYLIVKKKTHLKSMQDNNDKAPKIDFPARKIQVHLISVLPFEKIYYTGKKKKIINITIETEL